MAWYRYFKHVYSFLSSKNRERKSEPRGPLSGAPLGAVAIAIVVAMALLLGACPAAGGSGAGGGPSSYICEGGTAVEGTTDTAGQTKCSACNDGYRLTGSESCAALCSEDNGTYTLEPTADGGGTISFRMITVPVGTGLNFPTGVNDDGDATIDTPYSIAETELTIRVYQRVREWAVASARGAARYELPARSADPDQPVRISWHDSIKFANALSEYCAATGSTPIYLDGGAIQRTDPSDRTINPTISATASGFRLPTNNEWELAARYIGDMNNDGDIKDGGEFYPGNYASGADASTDNAEATGRVAWSTANSSSLQPVRQKRPNALGLYDMSGNEWEWSFDSVPGSPTNRVYALGGRYDNSSSVMRIGMRSDITLAIGGGVRLVR